MNKRITSNLILNLILTISLYISIYFLSLIMMGDRDAEDYLIIGSISITVLIIYIWNKKIKHE